MIVFFLRRLFIFINGYFSILPARKNSKKELEEKRWSSEKTSEFIEIKLVILGVKP